MWGTETVIGRAAIKRAPDQVPDLFDLPDYPLHYVQEAGYRALLALPLLREDRLIGGLVVRRKAAGEFPAPVVDLLQTFAAQSVSPSITRGFSVRSRKKGVSLPVPPSTSPSSWPT